MTPTNPNLSALGETSKKYTGKFAEQGTSASGFASDGPYHCEDCIHAILHNAATAAAAKDDEDDEQDERALGCCYHPAVMRDPAVLNKDMPDGTPGDQRKQDDGSILVDLEKECCRYARNSST